MPDKKKNAAAWLVTVIGGAWLGLFPLLSGFSYSHITQSKWEIMLVMTAVSLVLGLTAFILAGWRRWLDPCRLLFLGYFLWVVLSAVFGSWADHRQGDQLTVWVGSSRHEGLLTQLGYMGIFLAMSAWPPRRAPVRAASALGLIVFSVIVGLQYASLNPLGLFPAGRSIRTNYEFQGTIGNIDMVVGYLSLAVPLALGGWIFGRSAPRRKTLRSLENGGGFGLTALGGWIFGRSAPRRKTLRSLENDGGFGLTALRWLELLAGTAGMLLFLLIEVQCGLIALGVLLLLVVGLMMVRSETRAPGLAVLGMAAFCVALRRLIGLPWLDNTQEIVFPMPMTPTTLAALLLGVILLVSALALTWRRPRAKRAGGMPFAAVVTFLVLLIAALLVFTALAPIPEHAGGLYELHELLAGRPQDHFGSWRLGIWRHTLELSRDNLLFGTGPDTFYPAILDHLARESVKLGENFDNPHNLFLAILVNNGLPALVLYAAAIGAVLIRCIRRKTGSAIQLAWMIVCFSVQSFFTFSICITSPMLWAVLGMACAILPARDAS